MRETAPGPAREPDEGEGGYRGPDASSGGQDHANRIGALEWLVSGLGLLLVLGVLVFMVAEAARGNGEPPRITVHLDSVIAMGDAGYLVQFAAENRGDATAAGVEIVGEIRDAAGVETRRASLDYVPGRSTRRGGLLFRRDPREATVHLWAEGYRLP